jgi:hypothetical protein
MNKETIDVYPDAMAIIEKILGERRPSIQGVCDEKGISVWNLHW